MVVWISGSPIFGEVFLIDTETVDIRRRTSAVDSVRVGEKRHRIAGRFETRAPGVSTAGNRYPTTASTNACTLNFCRPKTRRHDDVIRVKVFVSVADPRSSPTLHAGFAWDFRFPCKRRFAGVVVDRIGVHRKSTKHSLSACWPECR